jgi:RNase H-fold protein (predicted Holliday junction resolvase)|tara:strand:- start:320 stop:802 length:483 start_codon:yes stop_codon:yes gene_type:complete
VNHPIPLLFEDITEKDIVVIHGLISQKIDSGLNQDQLLLGIDPGKQIGLSVYYLGNEISSSFFISTDKLIEQVINILAELKAKQKIIKIGNGDMKMAKNIAELLNLKFCSNFEIEFVDERSTTLKIKNFNQRGKRDMLSAQFITQRNGYWRSVLPLSITG